MEEIRIKSFNCHGVLNKLPVIRDICNDADIVFLQETWLLVHDLNVFDSLGDQFSSFSTSSVDDGELLIGRPHGGLTIIWRKSIGALCNIIDLGDKRCLGLRISSGERTMLAINVYLPYYCEDNIDEYNEYIGKIASIVEDSDSGDLMILGDFNCDVGSYFYEQWRHFCNEYGAIFSDVERLPADTVTHVNSGSLTCSWLDHCLCSETLHRAITDLSIDANYHASDHFPLSIKIKLAVLPATVIPSPVEQSIKWDFENKVKLEIFYDMLISELERGPLSHDLCSVSYCENLPHSNLLEDVWDRFSDTVAHVGERVFGLSLTSERPRNVPGWNRYVKELYHSSRQAFFTWKEANAPRDGPIAYMMRSSRAAFKLALREC